MIFYRGLPVERKPHQKPACQTYRGCPKGTPENQNSLSPRNNLAYQHYLRCRAVGRFPDDPMVAYNAKIISEVLAQCSAEQLAKQEDNDT